MTECQNQTCSARFEPASYHQNRQIYCSERCRHAARNPGHRIELRLQITIDLYRRLQEEAAWESAGELERYCEELLTLGVDV